MTGSRDSRDRTWTKGERDSTRRNRDKGKPLARLGDPPLAVLRTYIADQVCWWCGAGPWKSLAQHTAKSHGIYGADVRRLAGLFKDTVICSEKLSDSMTAIAARPTAHLPTPSLNPRPRVMSEAGRESYRKRLQAWKDSVGPVEVARQRQRATAAMVAVRSKPHRCTAPSCSVMVLTAMPNCCSPKCRKEVRQVTGRKSMLQLNERRRRPNDDNRN